MNWQLIVGFFFSYAILLYSLLLICGYIFIAIYSIGEIEKYLHKNILTDYRLLAESADAPSISILAPAYNEGHTIVENVRSLLSIYYTNLEIIIINDGSKDDSLEKLIAIYDLYPIEYFYNELIQTKEIINVYKSHNPVYKRLKVVDKKNGGKADALNMGVNIAINDYIVCIDVDCILEQDAILKLAKPFMEYSNERVIAAGGVVRIANSCDVENGKLIQIHLPTNFLARVQALEYTRAFLLGRMAWSRLNGLLLISGAFGAFEKEIVIEAGGYNTKTVGEDIELLVRMRRYMEEKNEKYVVSFIPDPLCWTEAPSSFKILGRQRNRWARGTIETLKIHKKMFFNPRYGVLGMLSYPYWFFFEFLAPIIEFIGLLIFILLCFFNLVNWSFFIALLVCVYSFAFLYSSFAILMEVASYNQYNKPTDIVKLLITALIEPIFFHPFVVWSAIKGTFDLIRKKHTWGEMSRTGFVKKVK
jgi:biofilm PGA synthesis N-glycosyltransferase PgaC